MDAREKLSMGFGAVRTCRKLFLLPPLVIHALQYCNNGCLNATDNRKEEKIPGEQD